MRQLALLIALVTAAVAARADAPNILFIAVDDLNDWIEPMGGHPQANTPNFARLARRSTLFSRAYTAAPACKPVPRGADDGGRPIPLGSLPERPSLASGHAGCGDSSAGVHAQRILGRRLREDLPRRVSRSGLVARILAFEEFAAGSRSVAPGAPGERDFRHREFRLGAAGGRRLARCPTPR